MVEFAQNLVAWTLALAPIAWAICHCLTPIGAQVHVFGHTYERRPLSQRALPLAALLATCVAGLGLYLTALEPGGERSAALAFAGRGAALAIACLAFACSDA